MRIVPHVLFALVLLVPSAYAQVQVIESQPQSAGEESLYPKPRGRPDQNKSLYPEPGESASGTSAQSTRARAAARPAPSGNAAGDLFFQVQALQEELMLLRGQVEEQEQTILQLKQQRLDDYMSLDRRISDLISARPRSDPLIGAANGAQPTRPVSRGLGVSPTVGEQEAYRNAYDLVRERQFPEATLAFEAFLVEHPGGELTANALYWLGELYMLEGRNDAARQRFEALLARFPDNRKAPDAMFKLGKVYHLASRNADARRMLEKVGTEHAGSSAARLASEYLQQNF